MRKFIAWLFGKQHVRILQLVAAQILTPQEAKILLLTEKEIAKLKGATPNV